MFKNIMIVSAFCVSMIPITLLVFYTPYSLSIVIYSLLSCIVGSTIGATAYFLLQTGQKSLSDNLCIFLQVITSFSVYLFVLAIW